MQPIAWSTTTPSNTRKAFSYRQRSFFNLRITHAQNRPHFDAFLFTIDIKEDSCNSNRKSSILSTISKNSWHNLDESYTSFCSILQPSSWTKQLFKPLPPQPRPISSPCSTRMPATHARPRKGGSTRRAWICCLCFYHNKTGKFRNCQNPNKEDCEGVERQRELTQSGRSWKEKTEVEGNHERCDECWPLEGEAWHDADGKGPGRRW